MFWFRSKPRSSLFDFVCGDRVRTHSEALGYRYPGDRNRNHPINIGHRNATVRRVINHDNGFTRKRLTREVIIEFDDSPGQLWLVSEVVIDRVENK